MPLNLFKIKHSSKIENINGNTTLVTRNIMFVVTTFGGVDLVQSLGVLCPIHTQPVLKYLVCLSP